MCGLFGAVGGVSLNKALIRSLACHNLDRGKDSTGFFGLRKEKKVLMKAARPAHELIMSEEFNKMFQDDLSVICGHVRQATHGSVCSKNAHPFRVGNTIGAHNGVVSNLQEIRALVKQSYDVDSEFLIHMINEKESVEAAAGSINLVWHKSDDSIGADIRICRHNNPMSLAFSPNKKSMIYSSDDEHLKYAMATMGLDWKIERLEEDTQMAIFMDGQNIGSTTKLDFKCRGSTGTNYKGQGWQGGEY